jgi:rhodanese-related sulfurtransferase/uncharacterized membrane protein YphA (DoxX/SURF4 family)
MKHLPPLLASVWTYRAVRAALAIAFLVAGFSKLADIRSFVLTIKAFGVLPSDIVKPVAMAMPGLEILGGALLLCDAPGGLAIITSLLLLFIGVIVHAIGQGLDIDCGCYGPGDIEGEVYHGLWPTLWRDSLMLAGVVFCLLWRWFRSRPSRPETPNLQGVFMRAVKLILALLTVIALAAPALADKFEDETAKEKEAVKLVRDTQKGGYGLVSTEELKKWLDEKKPLVIVDTMPFEDSYKKEHVPGAVSFVFPIPDMDTWDAKETGGKSEADYAKLLGPDKDKTIVVYCGFVKCTRSHNGAVWAKKLGYKNVVRYPGGIFAWKGAGLPAEAAK